MQKNPNHGLLIRKDNNPSDDFFGGVSRSMGQQVINESADWTDYLPAGEKQSTPYFDTMACVSYSALNCLEILQKYTYGYTVNYSDRALAKMSDTTQMGNYLHVVADTIRNTGLIYEENWPMNGTTWKEYMSDIPSDIVEQASNFHQGYDVKYEFVQNRQMKEALKYAPLQVTVYAWPSKVNDVYPDVKGKGRNHAVTLVGYKENKYWLIYDHYENFIKKIEWDYNFGGTLKYSLDKKEDIIEKPMIKNNTLCFNATTGAFGLYLDEKMLIDKVELLQATFIMRNNGDINGRCKTMFSNDWDKIPAYNLKGEKI